MTHEEVEAVRARVLELIQQRPGIANLEAADLLGLRSPQCYSHIKSLLADERIHGVKTAREAGAPGRTPVRYYPGADPALVQVRAFPTPAHEPVLARFFDLMARGVTA